jgi:hypothetical protein
MKYLRIEKMDGLVEEISRDEMLSRFVGRFKVPSDAVKYLEATPNRVLETEFAIYRVE